MENALCEAGSILKYKMTSSPLRLRFRLQELADAQNITVSPGDIGASIGHIQTELVRNSLLCEGETQEQLRRLIFGFLFGDCEKPLVELSSHSMSNGQIYAVKRWVGAQKIEDEWIPRHEFLPELIEVVKVVHHLRQDMV